MLKAYIANFEGEEWAMLIHGETRGKAKSRFWRCNPMGTSEIEAFKDIRLTRLPGQDNKPFTYENAKAAGFEYTEDDGSIPVWDGDFYNDCDCEICKGYKEKINV